MLHISDICQLVHMQISNHYISIDALYEPTAINNVASNTGMHTFHIIGICLWTNMPPTSHTYVPLHCYSILHIDPTLLDTEVQKKWLQLFITMLLPYMCHQVCPYICLIWHQWNQQCDYKHWYTYIHIITYAPEQACLPHCTYMFHCSANIVYIWIPHYHTYM